MSKVFISYRRVDSVYAVDQLDERLKQAFGADAVFRDASSIEPGAPFPDHIRRALTEARVALVVIGPWWLKVTNDPRDPNSPRRLDDPSDWVRLEIESLLQRGPDVPIIPLLLGGVGVPKADGLPPSLRTLPERNGMALLPYPDFDHCVELVIATVAKHLGVVPRPFVSQPPSDTEPPPRIAAPRMSVTGREFVGRAEQLHLLDEAWGRSRKEDKINIVSFIGQGGEGKTALALNWYARRAHHGWQGARRVFDWSFYSQGSGAQSAASADDFFKQAFEWFGYTGEVPKDPWAKGQKLAELVAAERTLLVLDGLEPLQQAPGNFGGEFKDPSMKALLRALALRNPGLCILTSRTDITDLADFEHADGSCLRQPLHALDTETARGLLHKLGVTGPAKELDEAITWFKGHAYDLNLLGNYLRQCTNDHDIRQWKEIALLKPDELVHGRTDASGRPEGHGRRMLRAYERWLGPDSAAMAMLRLLGLFDRPARSDLLDELRAKPAIAGLTDALVNLPEASWLRILDQLEQLRLIRREKISQPAETVNMTTDSGLAPDEIPDELLEMFLKHDDMPAEMKKLPKPELKRLLAQALGKDKSQGKKAARPRRAVSYEVDTHPLLREHFAAELREKYGEAKRTGHRRLYEYLCATTPDKSQPTLEDLQPLYQAVAHGCQAGLQQETYAKVFNARIRRHNENYSWRKLGVFGSDLGAVACFFDQPWSAVSPVLASADQSFLLNAAAFRLRALGRLAEALEPMRVSGEMDVKVDEWSGAAISFSNLSELELTLGEVARAVGDAEQCLDYAKRVGISSSIIIRLARLADSQHQAGRKAKAQTRFREAEQILVESQPDYPLLYSLPGFQYCDLLLAAPERAAWQFFLGRSRREDAQTSSPESQKLLTSSPTLIESCRAVSQRAAQTLKWISDYGRDVFSPSLDHLTLGRAALYKAILTNSEFRIPN